jgi:hypothetical protein
MKKQTKTQQIRNKSVINKGVKAAAVLAFAPLALTGCPTTIEYRDVPGPEVPTYPEITIPIRLWTGTMYLKCPGDLMNESSSKINAAATEAEGFVSDGTVEKSKIISLLSNKTVTIEVKKDGYPSAIQADDSYTIYVNYSRVQNSDVIIDAFKMSDEIFSALKKLSTRYQDEISQAKIMGDAKNIVRLAFAKAPVTLFG